MQKQLARTLACAALVAAVAVRPAFAQGGNPAAARNRGAMAAQGDPLVFLDADCIPADDWLARLLAGHDAGAAVVGGALDLPSGLPPMARCDYYCGWYHVHSRRPAGSSTPATTITSAATSAGRTRSTSLART